MVCLHRLENARCGTLCDTLLDFGCCEATTMKVTDAVQPHGLSTVASTEDDIFTIVDAPTYRETTKQKSRADELRMEPEKRVLWRSHFGAHLFIPSRKHSICFL